MKAGAPQTQLPLKLRRTWNKQMLDPGRQAGHSTRDPSWRWNLQLACQPGYRRFRCLLPRLCLRVPRLCLCVWSSPQGCQSPHGMAEPANLCHRPGGGKEAHRGRGQERTFPTWTRTKAGQPRGCHGPPRNPKDLLQTYRTPRLCRRPKPSLWPRFRQQSQKGNPGRNRRRARQALLPGVHRQFP